MELMPSRTAEVGKTTVRRALPQRSRRTVGAWCFADHFGPTEAADGMAIGPHPHIGLQTVTWLVEGGLLHKDSLGTEQPIRPGQLNLMTAGHGIAHAEESLWRGHVGTTHGIQLWVNLPAADKFLAPRYQDLEADQVQLLASDDAGALLRVVAGEVDGHRGPGSTFTPITFAHATITPGSQLSLPWRPDFNALVYVLSGRGTVGAEGRPIEGGQLAVLGAGDRITVAADAGQDSNRPAMEVLLLGGEPIREPVVQYGPFVMNTKEELVQALEDYQAGRLGVIPPDALMPHRAAGGTDPR